MKKRMSFFLAFMGMFLISSIELFSADSCRQEANSYFASTKVFIPAMVASLSGCGILGLVAGCYGTWGSLGIMKICCQEDKILMQELQLIGSRIIIGLGACGISQIIPQLLNEPYKTAAQTFMVGGSALGMMIFTGMYARHLNITSDAHHSLEENPSYKLQIDKNNRLSKKRRKISPFSRKITYRNFSY